MFASSLPLWNFDLGGINCAMPEVRTRGGAGGGAPCRVMHTSLMTLRNELGQALGDHIEPSFALANDLSTLVRSGTYKAGS